MFGSRRKPKKFSYEPRYYDPEKDERLKRRMRMKSGGGRSKTPHFIWLVGLLALGVWLYWTL